MARNKKEVIEEASEEVVATADAAEEQVVEVVETEPEAESEGPKEDTYKPQVIVEKVECSHPTVTIATNRNGTRKYCDECGKAVK